ncbi:hypothetical protein [Priestia megaterium]|uniref:hypothetical protein n=1 Tax=Priestia megaterium TaxID=1404 RepID=UPI000BFC0CAE|nr:hypothetical protein [Priestia megaterium]PGT76774.1 hypothetical protein COD15_02860 [Priestia megaterium]
MNVITGPDQVKYNLFGKEPFSSVDISFVYKNIRGEYRLVENGEQLTRAELKGKKYNLRYTIQNRTIKMSINKEFPSADIGDNFFIEANISVKILNPVELIRNGLSDISDYVIEYLFQKITRLTKGYTISEYTELEERYPHQLDLTELEQEGLKVTISGSVDLNEELKARIKDQRQQLENIDFANTKKKKESEELMTIFQGTAVEFLLPLFSDVDGLRKHILSEMNDRNKLIKELAEKYVKGEIDEVQYKRGANILGEASPLSFINQGSTAKIEEKKEKRNSFSSSVARLSNVEDEE